MATQLNAVSSTLLPPTITGPIFAKASEESAVMRLARRVPLSVSAQTAIPVPMDIPVAGWVSEGGVKPASQVGVGVKVMTGKKVALLVPVSQEVVMTNPAGLYSQLQQDLPTAIGRAFDQAAINGKDCAPVVPARSPTTWRRPATRWPSAPPPRRPAASTPTS
jgi:HK97 family phage major capsid protein